MNRMPKITAKAVAIACVLGGGLGLSACAVSRLHISDDYGRAAGQDLAAQIADPDAQYKGTPAPGADGNRVDLAQDRYNRNAVIRPASTATSTAVSGTGNPGGGGSSGAGAAAGP
jgi:hypothetical protein